jgi:hypothetical protein
MSVGADRNLLFGILALQMDFINRDALIAAMNAWVLTKGRALGDILVEQHGLTADDRVWLEVGVEVAPAVPPAWRVTGQAQVRLVDQGGGLERLARTLLGQHPLAP